MSRNPSEWKGGPRLDERLRTQNEAKARLAERTRSVQAVAAQRRASRPAPAPTAIEPPPVPWAEPPRLGLEAAALAEAVARVSLIGRAEDGAGQAPPGRLARAAEDIRWALATGGARSVLTWPRQPCSPLTAHDVLALALQEAAPRRTDAVSGLRAAAAAPMTARSVYFPAAPRGAAERRHLLAPRAWLERTGSELLAGVVSRRQRGNGAAEDGRVEAYAMTVVRFYQSRDLLGATLQELMPEFVLADGGRVAPRSPPLERFRRALGFDTLNTGIGLLADARRALWPALAVAPGRAEATLRASGWACDAPTALLLDLGEAGRGRLGERSWLDGTRRFLDASRSVFGGPLPVVAVTDDPWCHAVLMDRILPEHVAAAAEERVELCRTREPLAVDERPTVAVQSEFHPRSFGGAEAALIAESRALARRAQEQGALELAAALAEAGHGLRRALSLPGSESDLRSVLEAAIDDRDHVGAWMRFHRGDEICVVLARAEDDDFSVDLRREACALRQRIGCALAAAAIDTPMAALLRDAFGRATRQSSGTLMVFPDPLMHDVACRAAVGDAAHGRKVAERLEGGMIRTIACEAAPAALAEAEASRGVGAAVFVAASARAATGFLAEPWLPRKVSVVADAITMRGLTAACRRLAAIPGLGAVAERCRAFAERAEADGIAPLDEAWAEDGEPSRRRPDRVIDLRGRHPRSSADDRTIRLRSGTRLLVRPATRLVRYDGSEPVNPYVEISGSAVRAGHELCVLGDDFALTTREMLCIIAVAHVEVRDYQKSIQKALKSIPGHSLAMQAREIIRRMAARTPTWRGLEEQRVRHWLDVERHLAEPDATARPHAPDGQALYLAFMQALGIPEADATRWWTDGIDATRRERIRAGHRAAQAYVRILTAHHAYVARNPGMRANVEALRRSAERLVDEVVAIE